ncbi:HU family DNA-binding protein [Synechococcus sp. MIT S9510]
MNLKEINQAISEAENIHAGKVRKVTKALLERFEQAIDNGEKLKLPGLTFTPRILPAKEPEDGKAGRPERKVAVMRRKDSNKKVETT